MYYEVSIDEQYHHCQNPYFSSIIYLLSIYIALVRRIPHRASNSVCWGLYCVYCVTLNWIDAELYSCERVMHLIAGFKGFALRPWPALRGASVVFTWTGWTLRFRNGLALLRERSNIIFIISMALSYFHLVFIFHNNFLNIQFLQGEI